MTSDTQAEPVFAVLAHPVTHTAAATHHATPEELVMAPRAPEAERKESR